MNLWIKLQATSLRCSAFRVTATAAHCVASFVKEIKCLIKGTTIIYCYLFAHFFSLFRVLFFIEFYCYILYCVQCACMCLPTDVRPLTFQSLIILFAMWYFPFNWISHLVRFSAKPFVLISNSIFLTSWQAFLSPQYCCSWYARLLICTISRLLTCVYITIRYKSNIETTICYAWPFSFLFQFFFRSVRFGLSVSYRFFSLFFYYYFPLEIY